MPPKPKPPQPVVRVAPLGDLDAYYVYEHELDALEKGSPGSHLLGLAYALIPFAAAFVIALVGTDIPSERVYTAFVLVSLVTGLAGVICLILGVAGYQSNRALVARIKGRMPPPATAVPPAPPPPDGPPGGSR